MIKYEVNQPFPFPHPAPGAEITLSEITTSLFDIKAYLHSPTSEEVKDWRKGPLQYGIYQQDSCPFFIIKFQTWSVDVSINVLKINSEEGVNEWLNNEGNIIQMFLINAPTNILKAMRMISIPSELSERLRDILEAQAEKHDVRSAERKIAEIQHAITTEEMISRTKMYRL